MANLRIKQVAIIGGGLAGLTLAIKLVRSGTSVILFEKENYPFHKVCGEYIAMESWDFLRSCGIPLEDMNLPRIKKLRVSSPNGNFLEHELGKGGFGISRFTLDKMLADVARREGVEIKENLRVDNVLFNNDGFEIEAGQEHYNTKVVVGSYGKRSNLDIKLNRDFILSPQPTNRNFLGIKYHIKAALADDVIELHNFKDGYCGISKVDGDKFCLCYLTTAKNLQLHGSIKKMEEKILMKNPFLHKYFTESEFLYETPLVISQINFASKSIVDNHILMAGDSAGLIAPLCGNGMSMAMNASKLLSQLIPQFLNAKISRTALEGLYKKQWKQFFSFRLLAGRYIQYSFGKEVLTNSMIGILKHFPSAVGKLESLTHGKSF